MWRKDQEGLHDAGTGAGAGRLVNHVSSFAANAPLLNAMKIRSDSERPQGNNVNRL